MLNRVPRRILALLTVVCALAGCNKHVPRERTVSVADIVKADAEPGARGQQVRTTAVVTYSDPDWRVMFVQDRGAAIYIELPPHATAQSGDRVEITGAISSLATGLDHATISVLSRNNALPPPFRVTDYSALPGSLSEFVAVEGTVRWTGVKDGRPAVQLSSGEKPLLAYVRQALIADLPPLGSRVSVAGVDAADVDSSGQLRGTKLFSPSDQYLKVLNSGPSDPFSLPVKTLTELKGIPAGTLVHVSGEIRKEEQGLAITDGKQSVPLNARELFQGTSADVAGFWTGRSLDDALVRPRSESVNREAATRLPEGDIAHLSDLKRMSEVEAAARKRVSVRAVVTYFDPDWRLLFVQDRTAAAFVNIGNLDLRARPGDLVDVSGVSGPGDFAPIIVEPTVGFVGRAPLPTPFRADLLVGNLAEADSMWCTFRGVVHTAQEQGGHTNLKIGAGQTEVTVQLPMLIHGDELVDKEVSVTGVFGVIFNDRRQAVGHQIFVPASEFLTVVDHEVKQSAPATIASLRRYTLDADERHSVTLKGTVVLKGAADTIFIQDSSGGMQVRAAGPVSVADGDKVSVRGFVIPGDYSPALEDAVVTRDSSGGLPNPTQISAKSALEGAYDSGYVAMHGTVTAINSDRQSTILVLNDNGTYFDATGPPSQDLTSLRLGSEVKVRGVCRVSVDRIPFSIRGFTLAFDSPRSVEVIKLGPWWDSRKIAWALMLIVMIAAAVILWATLLRQQVEIKTRELQSSIAAKRKARDFDIARNQVLEAIARNAPPPESMERLAQAVQQHIEGALCLIAIAPDAPALLNGKSSPTVVAPDLPEELQRQMQPVLSTALVRRRDAGGANPRAEDQDVLANLLAISRRGDLEFNHAQVMYAFSGSGERTGLLMVLLKDAPPADADSAIPNVLHSASRLVSLARDHWHMHERLLFEARHDALTGLPNRTLSEDRLEQALARARRRKQIFAAVCIDLDGFKSINDNLGHHAGDELLRTVAVRLRNRIRHSDTLARIGGDEFLAIIEDCSGDAAAQSVAESLVAALHEPVTLEGKTVTVSGSIGIAMYPADGKNAAELKRNADQAMYRAKSRSGGQICFWSGDPLGTGKVVKVSSSSGT